MVFFQPVHDRVLHSYFDQSRTVQPNTNQDQKSTYPSCVVRNAEIIIKKCTHFHYCISFASSVKTNVNLLACVFILKYCAKTQCYFSTMSIICRSLGLQLTTTMVFLFLFLTKLVQCISPVPTANVSRIFNCESL